MSVFLVVDSKIKNEEKDKQYIEQVTPIVELAAEVTSQVDEF